MTVELVELVLAGIGAGARRDVRCRGRILFVPALVLVADLGQLEVTATSLAAMIPPWPWEPGSSIGTAMSAGGQRS